MTKLTKLKKSIKGLPLFGYVAMVIDNFVRSPQKRADLAEKSDKLFNNISELTKANEELQQHINTLEKKIKSVRLRQDELTWLENSVNSVSDNDSPTQHAAVKPVLDGKSNLFADNHELDVFYTNFEDKFRGSEDFIVDRLHEYLPYFNKLKKGLKSLPILDIGSGRGEMLQVLNKAKFEAIGLDINYDMVKRSQKKGLSAIQGDAITHLQNTKSQSYSAITGFHIVEHIPFDQLITLFKQAHRSLAEDGFVLFETPNPENIIVATAGFYMDPSHLNPLPPDLLAYALESCGFRDVEILRLHPVETNDEQTIGLPQEVAGRFYGPRDYAVLGYK